MHVIEIFLPLQRNDGSPQPRELFGKVRKELIEKFGGLTAYSRAPAEGLWERDEGSVDKDAIVIFEVMAEVARPQLVGQLPRPARADVRAGRGRDPLREIERL